MNECEAAMFYEGDLMRNFQRERDIRELGSSFAATMVSVENEESTELLVAFWEVRARNH